jgi:hypothetical protein
MINVKLFPIAFKFGTVTYIFDEHLAHQLGDCGQQPSKPNQTMRATTIEGPDPPNLVQRMFGGFDPNAGF